MKILGILICFAAVFIALKWVYSTVSTGEMVIGVKGITEFLIIGVPGAALLFFSTRNRKG